MIQTSLMYFASRRSSSKGDERSDYQSLRTAIIGALGAVLGATLVSVFNVLIERSRRKQEETKRAARDERELRQGGRLVLEELSEIDGVIRNAVRSHLAWGEDRQLPAFAWQEHRATLAVHLDQEPWRLLGFAYRAANDLNWRVIELQHDLKGNPGPVHFIQTEWLRPAFRAVREAMESLERVMGPQAGVFGYTGYASTEEIESELWATADEDAIDS